MPGTGCWSRLSSWRPSRPPLNIHVSPRIDNPSDAIFARARSSRERKSTTAIARIARVQVQDRGRPRAREYRRGSSSVAPTGEEDVHERNTYTLTLGRAVSWIRRDEAEAVSLQCMRPDALALSYPTFVEGPHKLIGSANGRNATHTQCGRILDKLLHFSLPGYLGFPISHAIMSSCHFDPHHDPSSHDVRVSM